MECYLTYEMSYLLNEEITPGFIYTPHYILFLIYSFYYCKQPKVISEIMFLFFSFPPYFIPCVITDSRNLFICTINNSCASLTPQTFLESHYCLKYAGFRTSINMYIPNCPVNSLVSSFYT